MLKICEESSAFFCLVELSRISGANGSLGGTGGFKLSMVDSAVGGVDTIERSFKDSSFLRFDDLSILRKTSV